MRTYNVAILGATGAVGQEMIKILMERNFPINELHLLASKRSAGKKMEINGKEYSIEETTEQSFQGMDIVLGAAENDIAKRFLPKAVEAGAVVVDNSSAYRLDPNVPLVIPEVNQKPLLHITASSPTKLRNDHCFGSFSTTASLRKGKTHGRINVSGSFWSRGKRYSRTESASWRNRP